MYLLLVSHPDCHPGKYLMGSFVPKTYSRVARHCAPPEHSRPPPPRAAAPFSSLSSVSPLRKRYVQSTYQMRYQRHGSTRTAGGSRAPPPAAGESWTYILTSCPYTRARAQRARPHTRGTPK